MDFIKINISKASVEYIANIKCCFEDTVNALKIKDNRMIKTGIELTICEN